MTVNTATPDYIVDGVLTDGESWVPLSSTVVSGTSTATITMESTTGVNDWSQYMDLVLIWYAKIIDASSGANSIRMKFNTSSSDFLTQSLLSNGSSGYADQGAYPQLGYAPVDTPADVFSAGKITLGDINSGKYKAWQGQMSAVAFPASYYGYVSDTVGVWQQTAPLTQIDLHEGNNYNFVAGSRFDLFGVLPRMVTV